MSVGVCDLRFPSGSSSSPAIEHAIVCVCVCFLYILFLVLSIGIFIIIRYSDRVVEVFVSTSSCRNRRSTVSGWFCAGPVVSGSGWQQAVRRSGPRISSPLSLALSLSHGLSLSLTPRLDGRDACRSLGILRRASCRLASGRWFSPRTPRRSSLAGLPSLRALTNFPSAAAARAARAEPAAHAPARSAAPPLRAPARLCAVASSSLAHPIPLTSKTFDSSCNLCLLPRDRGILTNRTIIAPFT